MGNLTRRQILLGGGAIVGAGLAPVFPATTGSSAFNLISAALGADIAKPDQPIKMSSNENPYGPSRVALQAIAENIHLTNRYAADSRNLIKVVANINNISPDHVMTGTGSSEILNVAGMLVGLQQGSVVCADPTYQSLLDYAENAGVEIIRVRVSEGLNADLDGMRKAVRSDTNMMYIVNPNNPIPSVIEKNAMKAFVLEQAEDRLVFVDEAYHEYVDNPDYESMIGLIAEGYNNIIVSRTSSKIHGLAGMRVGFGFAHPDLINEMNLRKTGADNSVGTGRRLRQLPGHGVSGLLKAQKQGSIGDRRTDVRGPRCSLRQIQHQLYIHRNRRRKRRGSGNDAEGRHHDGAIIPAIQYLVTCQYVDTRGHALLRAGLQEAVRLEKVLQKRR